MKSFRKDRSYFKQDLKNNENEDSQFTNKFLIDSKKKIILPEETNLSPIESTIEEKVVLKSKIKLRKKGNGNNPLSPL